MRLATARLATAVALVFVLVLAAGATGPAEARANVSVSVSFFYDSLAPHGYWYDSPRYGYVWQPAHLHAGWRPYWNGRWAYTDFGWTFVSHDPWGWATDHYGRWYFDPVLGWVWVPDTEWGPAWVTFYEADDWIGWAPLPPGGGFSLAFSRRPFIDPGGYCFVERRFFVDSQIHRRVVAPSRNAALIRHARASRTDGLFVHRGPSVQRVAEAVNRPVPRLRVVETSEIRGARIQGQAVTMFRPEVRAKATHPPRGARALPARQGSRPEARQQQRPPERRALAPAQRPQRRSPEETAAPEPQRRSQQVARAPQQHQRRAQQVAPAPQRQRRAPQVAPAPPHQRRSQQVAPAPQHQRRSPQARQAPHRQQPRATQAAPTQRRNAQARPQGRERPPARQPQPRQRPRGPRPPGA